MAIADHYPVGMSFCDEAGLNGNCGVKCSRFLEGECPIETDVTEDITDEVYGEIVYDITDDCLCDRIEKIILNGFDKNSIQKK